MKKLMCLVAGAMIVAGSAWAGGACCPMSGKKSEEQAAAKPASEAVCPMECLETLNLTEEQAEAVKLAKAECDKMECGETAKKQMTEELAKILSAEQMAAMKAYCEKNCAQKS